MSGIVYLKVKTERANTQVNEIEDRLRKFLDSKPYTVTSYDDPKNLRHVFRYEVHALPEVETIGMLVGEFAYTLRSGLDQLAWQLAKINLKAPKLPRSATSFPIRSVPPDPKRGFGDSMKDILPAAATIIESLQPYHGVVPLESHPLWILNELCIIDKHMILPFNSWGLSGRVTEGVPIVASHGFHNYIEICVPLADAFHAQFYPDPPEIIFGEPIAHAKPITGTTGAFEVRVVEFRLIHDFVRDEIIPRFAGFFK